MNQVIQVTCRDGSRESVKAEIHGPLAIHESLTGVACTVTHIPTGKAVLPLVDYRIAVEAMSLLPLLDWRQVTRTDVDACMRIAMAEYMRRLWTLR